MNSVREYRANSYYSNANNSALSTAQFKKLSHVGRNADRKKHEPFDARRSQNASVSTTLCELLRLVRVNACLWLLCQLDLAFN
jgi:hypothetical protein